MLYQRLMAPFLQFYTRNNQSGRVMLIEETPLPNTLHLSYFSGMVVMPHCKCSVVLGGKNAETAKMVYQSSGQIGLVQLDYKKNNEKIGCYAEINNLTYPKDNRSDLVRLTISAIARFKTHRYVRVPNYNYTCAHVEYSTFDDLSQKEQKINMDAINPLLAKYFFSFLLDAGTTQLETGINDISLDRFLNSMIMIIPMSREERKFLSELKTTKEKEDALCMIMQVNEYNLTQTDLAH